MKHLPMIIAIVVSIFPAQGVLGQDELALLGNENFEFKDYEYELQEYTEINKFELPAAIQRITKKDFVEARIVKAYISKDNTYKVVLQKNDYSTKVVFASANGTLIQPNDHKS